LDIDNIQELSITIGEAVTQSEDEDFTEIFGSNDVGTIDSFHGISSLELYDTKLESVQFLYWFTNLQTLTMEHCSLTDHKLAQHDDVLLQSGSSMESINLSHNKLRRFPPVLLKTCDSVKYLNMSYNNIWVFVDIGDSFPLEYLDMSHSRLLVLTSEVFASFTHLTYLDLSNNHIEIILPGAFTNLHRLEYLDLSNNMVSTLQQSIFPPELPLHLTMKIVGNDFYCDSRMEWLVDAICDQASTGIGPFDWYDVYNVRCGSMLALEFINDGWGCDYA
jgi:Leucine-rich repeat (LRR) protein